MKKQEALLNDKQLKMMVVVGIATLLGLVGVITMSILGSTHGSFHLISLQSGWTGKLWDALWLGITGGTFFVLGVALCKITDSGKEEK